MPYLSEEIIYNLRNSLLHQSTPNIEKSTIHESRCRVDKFELVITGEDGTNGDLSEVAYDKDMNIVQRGLKVHISTCATFYPRQQRTITRTTKKNSIL